MRRLFNFFSCLLLSSLLFTGIPVSISQAAGLQLPRVFLPILLNGTDLKINPSTPVTLSSFIASVQNGKTDVVVGVYVQDALAQPVIQQPAGDYSFISPVKDHVTQFSLAQAPVVGLIAHNHLAGNKFSMLTTGQSLYLVFGIGRTAPYQINQVTSFQALDPASPTSSFLDLTTGQTLSAAQLFAQYYLGQNYVTLQTCITREGKNSWGRLLIVADPVQ